MLLVIASLAISEAASSAPASGTCGAVKNVYKDASCCGKPDQSFPFQVVPNPPKRLGLTSNQCAGKKPKPGGGFDNIACFAAGVTKALEQSGADVTAGFQGTLNAGTRKPITTSYFEQKLCPVNVHWHLGAEHRSAGQYDESGKGPGKAGTPANSNPNAGGRLLAGQERYGFACHKYDAGDAKFTTEYKWQHCIGMHVGETYEVHWPHSALGACHTPYQFQSSFYDGVFCGWTQAVADLVANDAQNLVNSVGVQAQVFTIVNDENYYYPDLMRGALIDGNHWKDVAAYTGSTTGTTRDNTVCSKYTPITWQVDRTCHLISASTFDKMCADMKQQPDDMTMDIHAHGAREVVFQNLTANNIGAGPSR